MLKVMCPEHLEEVRQFADKMNLRVQLEDQLTSLGSWFHECTGTECPYEIELHKDFAAYSFTFLVYRNLPEGRLFAMNGGLIYQGPGLPADGSFPQLTVSLHPGIGWFVHT